MERFGDAYRAYQRRVPCSCLVGVNGGSSRMPRWTKPITKILNDVSRVSFPG